MHRVPVNFEDVAYIATNLRAADRKEINAVQWDEAPEALARHCMVVPDFAFVFGKEKPIAALGGVPMWPGVWNIWMFATDEFPRIALPMTKWVKRAMIPGLWNAGVHRLECQSMHGHTSAQRWLEYCGATLEATHHDYGKNRETFHTFALRNPR